MYWLGLTGGIGSGKSTVAKMFQTLGVTVLDADAISRQLTASNGIALAPIRQIFGDAVFNGLELNRSALREQVFHCPQKKAQLEGIMLPLIFQQLQNMMANHHGVYGVIEIPLLAEQKIFQSLLDGIIVVDGDEDTRITRVQQRSHLSKNEIKRIMATQATPIERKYIADSILHNQGNLEELKQKVCRLHRFYHAHFHYLQRKHHDSI